VVLISDFQRSGWRGEEGIAAAAGRDAHAGPIQGGADQPNLSITGCRWRASTFSNQERVTVTAGVVNRTERPLRDGTIALEVNGLPMPAGRCRWRAGESASVTFEPFTLNARNMRGRSGWATTRWPSTTCSTSSCRPPSRSG
jgi:hypothetical protein